MSSGHSTGLYAGCSVPRRYVCRNATETDSASTFAVLVAGPMSPVKAHNKELAEIISAEIENHLGDLVPAEARPGRATAGA